MKVLICDDEEASLTKSELLLKKFGYETQAVNDPAKALTILCSPNAPKIAVLDWVMPKYNGIDICKKVRTLSSQISTYIIILTSKDGPENIEEALDAGANDFIKKPIEPIEFRARMAAGARIIALESELKTITGLIRICSWCKKIHLAEDSTWISVEEFIAKNSYAQFTHGGCPTCIAKVKQDQEAKVVQK